MRLTPDEAFALMAAGPAFSAWRGSSLGRLLNTALQKLGTVVGGAVSYLSEEVLKNITTVLAPAESPALVEEGRWLMVLMRAILHRQELRVGYEKLGAAHVQLRALRPLHLVYADQAWILIAFALDRGDYRTFIVGRMRDARPTGVKFAWPADLKATEHLEGNLDRYTGTGSHEVTLRFQTKPALHVTAQPWPPSQRVTRVLPDGCVDSPSGSTTWWISSDAFCRKARASRC